VELLAASNCTPGLVSDQEADQRRADVAAAEVRCARFPRLGRSASVAVQPRHPRRGAGVIGDVRSRIGDVPRPLTTIRKSNALELTVAIPAARTRLQPGAVIEIRRGRRVLVAQHPVYVATGRRAPSWWGQGGHRQHRRPPAGRCAPAWSTRSARRCRCRCWPWWQSGKAFVFAIIEKEGQLVVGAARSAVRAAGGGYRVDGGLNPGDRIAVSSLQSLRDGAPVTIQPSKT
jgi:hypothetical protein